MRKEGKCCLGHLGYRDDGLLQSQHKFTVSYDASTPLLISSIGFQNMVGSGRDALEYPSAELKTSIRVSIEGVDQIIFAMFMHDDGSHMTRICVGSGYLRYLITVSAPSVVLQIY